jgi:hypothetical protein
MTTPDATAVEAAWRTFAAQVDAQVRHKRERVCV